MLKNNSALERKCTTKVYMTKNSSPVQFDLFKLMTNGKSQNSPDQSELLNMDPPNPKGMLDMT